MTCYICNDKNNILTITNSIDVKIFTDSVSLCIVDMNFPDKLTLKLCVNCYDSLTAFNRFRQLCIRNEDYMKEIFKVKPKKKRKLNDSDAFPSIKTEPGTQSSKRENTSSEPAPKLKKAKKRKSENQDEGKPTKKLKKIKMKNEPVDPPLKNAKIKKKVQKTVKKKSEVDDASAKRKNQKKLKNVKKNERKDNLKNGKNSKNKKNNLESKKKNSSKKKNERQDKKIESCSTTENVFEGREDDTNLKSENVTTDIPNENYYKSSSSNNELHVCEKCNKVANKLQDLQQHVLAKHFRDLDYVKRLMRGNFSSYGRLSPGRTSRSTTYNRNSIERDINNYKEINHGESRRERNSESTEEHNSSEQPHSNQEHYSNSERYNEVNDQTNTLHFNSITIKKENLGSDEHYDALKYTIFEEDPNDLSVKTESHCYGENEKQDSSIVNTEIKYIDLV